MIRRVDFPFQAWLVGREQTISQDSGNSSTRAVFLTLGNWKCLLAGRFLRLFILGGRCRFLALAHPFRSERRGDYFIQALPPRLAYPGYTPVLNALAAPVPEQ